MLELHNFLWVIPGVIFIHMYNKKRPHDTINLSGWPYVFSLVLIAYLTWLPSEFIIESKNILGIEKNIVLPLISVLISIILFFISQCEIIAKWIFVPIHDNFYKKCVEWENEIVLLTLKNGKTYYAFLWKYPENPKSRHESQTISIAPITSGHRDNETKKVRWDTEYPEYENKSDLIDMELIIPRTEIITFGKFSIKTFEHLKE